LCDLAIALNRDEMIIIDRVRATFVAERSIAGGDVDGDVQDNTESLKS
jgi:hypothetical protein